MARERYIDPRFELPPVEDFQYEEELGAGVSGGNEEWKGDVGEFIGGDEPESPIDPDALYPPEEVTIVDQIVHISADGSARVDLVLEVSDVPGAIQYDARVSKR